MKSFEPGQRIANRYRLERRIGAGGMGEVWAAHHVVTEKRVAMKFVSTSLRLTPLLRERLFREAKAAGRVRHPGVIEIVDAFTLDDDLPVLVMELLEGESLAHCLLREEALPVTEAVNIMLQTVSAVGAAHERGIVHRDLKPDNVFLCETGNGVPRVKVLDFGVAKLAAPGEDSSGLTSMGQVLGTPAYMAPEQCRGEHDVDHRADMWAIGVMLYETLSGERPLEGRTVGEIVECLLTDGVPPLKQLAPEVPFDLAIAARRLLERKAKNRGEDLREIFEVLDKHASIEARAFGPAQVQRSQGGQEAPRSSRRLTVSEALQPTQSETLEPAQRSIPMVSSSRRPLWIAAAAVLAGVVGWRALVGGAEPETVAGAGAGRGGEALLGTGSVSESESGSGSGSVSESGSASASGSASGSRPPLAASKPPRPVSRPRPPSPPKVPPAVTAQPTATASAPPPAPAPAPTASAREPIGVKTW